MIIVLDPEQDEDSKPPQFFQRSYQQSIMNATKVLECPVDFLMKNDNTIDGQFILYQEYLAARIKQRLFFVEIDLTITLEANHNDQILKFKDSQRQLQLTVLFHSHKEFQLFYNQIKKSLFQTDFEQKYKILQKIGNGKTSLVYQVEDKVNGGIYAAKFYSNIPSTIKKQVEILRKLQHPNIIFFHEMFISNGKVYLIMDYEDGGTLLDKIQQKQFMTMKEKIKFLIDMLNAFEFLRIKNIVHRDLKPENILYSKKDNCYKITDFQLAIYQNQPITKLVGTPGYIAPQLFQAGEETLANQYADIYTLGLIYYEIATKQTYFKGQNIEAIIKANKKAKSLKRKKYSKQHISDLEYDILRMMIRTEVQDRKLSLQILQSTQLRKLVKEFALDKKDSNSSSSSSSGSSGSSSNPKQRKNSDCSEFQKGIDEQNLMNAVKRMLKIRSYY